MSSLPNINASEAWRKTFIGNAATVLATEGYFVFPCHGITAALKCTCNKPDCKSAGKHPYPKNGLLDATTDIAALAALFDYREDLNIGLVCGQKSGFTVLDIDGQKGGYESLAALEDRYGELPATPTSITGNGQHKLLKLPTEHIKSRANALGAEYPGIDVRNTGSYIIAPPSMHVSGKRYAWLEDSITEAPEMPAWLIDLLKDKPKPIRSIAHDYSNNLLSDWSRDEVWRMLDCLDPSMKRAEWINIGFGLKEGGWTCDMWESWSQKGNNYEAGECAKVWQGIKNDGGITFGTVVDMAQVAGWRPTPIERPPVDTSLADGLVNKIQYDKIRAIPAFKPDFDPLQLPELIGDTIRYINETAIRPQPMLALLNVLAFCGSVFGRRYTTPLDTRTNVYIVGIADTGAGKDHSRKVINKIAEAAMLSNFLGGNAIRSDTGMVKGLSNNSCQLLMLDEFGKMLQALTDKNASPHHKSIIRVLMDLYTRSSAPYNHGDYADPSKNEAIIINCPNLCIYGTTTESEYAKGLHRDAIESGELNRVIALKVQPVAPVRLSAIKPLPDDLVEQWKAFSPSAGGIGMLLNSPKIPPEPIIVEWGDCDDLQWNILQEQDSLGSDNPQTKALWNRRHENIIKIAMMFAIARDMTYPKFTKGDFDIAREIVDNAIKYMCVLASEQMVESPYEADQLKIITFLKRYKGWVPRSVLMTKMRSIERKRREDIVADMVERGEIEEYMEPARADGAKYGRKAEKYRLKR